MCRVQEWLHRLVDGVLFFSMDETTLQLGRFEKLLQDSAGMAGL